MTAVNERNLIRQASKGDQQAFGLLVEAHMKNAYNLAYRFMNDHHLAEEVAQEGFVRAYRSIKSFRGDSSFGTWLHRIIVNLSLNALKKRNGRPELTTLNSDVFVDRTVSSRQQDNVLLPSQIMNALSQLPPLQRTVVILRHLEGQSTREVSMILKCSEGTVKTHLFRGLKKLREKLGFLEEELA